MFVLLVDLWWSAISLKFVAGALLQRACVRLVVVMVLQCERECPHVLQERLIRQRSDIGCGHRSYILLQRVSDGGSIRA